jgi:recombination protein RecR
MACAVCGCDIDQEVCAICADPRRSRSRLCVVADTPDLIAVERTNEFRGLYHVLGGVISPMEGIGPDQLRLRELLERVHRDQVKEVILATNPQVEGEATAMYVHRLLKPLGINVSKIAVSLPMD